MVLYRLGGWTAEIVIGAWSCGIYTYQKTYTNYYSVSLTCGGTIIYVSNMWRNNNICF